MISESPDPLVSIVVITYNSSKYVIETLESIKTQTYKNIELVVTDDCSTDCTVEVCRNWIDENKKRFVRTKLILVDNNTGIPANCNRGLHAANGEWVKPIAGDDALISSCINDNIEFVKSNNEVSFCFSNFDSYKDNFEKCNLKHCKKEWDIRSRRFSELNAEFQFKVMVRHIIIHGPTTFYNRNKFLEMGGYDETYSFVEDRPTFLNWLSMGNKFYYLPKKTVKYRINTHSITNKKEDKNFHISDFTIQFGTLVYERLYKHLSSKEKLFYHIKYSYFKFFQRENRKNLFIRIFRRAWYFLVQLAERENYNSLNKFYKEYKRTML